MSNNSLFKLLLALSAVELIFPLHPFSILYHNQQYFADVLHHFYFEVTATFLPSFVFIVIYMDSCRFVIFM